MPSLVAEQVETEYKNETFEALILYSLFNSLVFPEIKLRETKEINKSIESFTFKHLRNSKKWMTHQLFPVLITNWLSTKTTRTIKPRTPFPLPFQIVHFLSNQTEKWKHRKRGVTGMLLRVIVSESLRFEQWKIFLVEVFGERDRGRKRETLFGGRG